MQKESIEHINNPSKKNADGLGSSSCCSNCGNNVSLQSRIGNQGTAKLYQDSLIQTKLEISDSSDKYEREADDIAEQITQQTGNGEANPTPIKPITPLVQPKSYNHRSRTQSHDTELSIPSHGAGSPLSRAERSFFEPRFGYDFGAVRIHTSPEASKQAKRLNAKAFTFGKDVFFGKNYYQPQTKRGRSLIAHELTHVVQQSNSQMARYVQRSPEDDENARLRRELIPTAKIEINKAGVFFVVSSEAVFQRGPKTPQLLRIALNHLLGDQYTDELVMPLVALLTSKKRFTRMGHFKHKRDAYKEEKILHFGFAIHPFLVILNYLKQKNLDVKLTEEQRKQLYSSYANSNLWGDINRIAKQNGIKLPRWYSMAFFNMQMSLRATELDKYQKYLQEFEATKDNSAKASGLEAAEDILYDLLEDVAILDAIRKDTSLYVNPQTQLAYQAIWFLTDKRRAKNKPALGLRSLNTAFSFLKFSLTKPDLRRNSETQNNARVALLMLFILEKGIEDKTTKVLPPYPAYIVSPDLNQNHTTVTTASNHFRMFTKMGDVHGGNLLHQTTISMAQRVYYSWRVHPLPDSLKKIKEKTNTSPEDFRKFSDEFVKSSPENLKSPVKEYESDRDHEQKVKMKDLSIGDYLLVGHAAPHYREDLHWVQQPSTAGHPFFVFDASTLATNSAYTEWDQLSDLKEQLKKAPEEDKENLKAQIEVLEKRESSGLLAISKKDLAETEKLLKSTEQLKQFIIDDRKKNTSRQGDASTDPFVIRLKNFNPALLDVYKMIRDIYNPREYNEIKAIDNYIEILKKQIDDLKRLGNRVGDAYSRFKTGSPTYRVAAAIVKEDDGNLVPLMLVAGYHPDTDTEKNEYKIKLVDVTFDAAKKGDMIYVGDTKSNEKDAVDSAFVTFGEDNKYGEGKVVYRLPQTSYKGSADSVTTFLEYLEYALAAMGIVMLIAGTIATAGLLSPAAVAVVTAIGVSLAVVGATLAARNMAKRSEKGTLEFDSETALDIISIIGAAVVVVGTVSKVTLAARSATLSRVLTMQRLDRLIAIYDFTELGANIYLINAKVQDDVKAIKALKLPKEQEDEMIAVVTFDALQQGAMMGVSAYSSFRQIPQMYRAKVEGSRYKSWLDKGWIKESTKGKLEITDSAPPFLQKIKPKVGKMPDKSMQGESARKSVVEVPVERVQTLDKKHHLTLTEQGRIIRCSDLCQDLRHRFGKIIAQDPDLHQQLLKIEKKAAKAAKEDNKALAKEAIAEAKALEGTLSWAEKQWQSFVKADDAEIDKALTPDAIQPGRVTGTKKSGFKIDGRRVPKRKRRRLDAADLMTQRESASKGGLKMALERVGAVMGKKVSEVDLLKKHWETAKTAVLKGKAVEDYSKDTVNKKLYPAARRMFWQLVRKDPAAVAFLNEKGFEFKSKRGAPLAVLGPVGKNTSKGKITNQERRVSLDHIDEKAQGENWKKALDADNLEFMFQNANSNKETVQVRHKMRAPSIPDPTLNQKILTPDETRIVSHGRASGMTDLEIEQFLSMWQKNPKLSADEMLRQIDQMTAPLKERKNARSRVAPDMIMDADAKKALPDFEHNIAGTGGIQKIKVLKNIIEGRMAVIIEGIILPGRLTRRKKNVTAKRRRAPDFNRSSSLFTRKEAKLSRQWQRLHLWGPGFGDEAAAGMMWGPKEINLVWQNDSIESYIRQLGILTQRHGGQTRLKATAISWENPTPSGWQAPHGEHFLKRVEYEITLQRPGQPDTTIRITIDVAEPPSPKLKSFDIDPPHAVNLGDLF